MIALIPKPFEHPMIIWLIILSVVFLLALFKVTPTNEEALAMNPPEGLG